MMSDDSARLLLEEVRQLRKLVELIAEPAIAQRDAKVRSDLKKIVGSSAKKQAAVFLMDGKRTQAQIVAAVSVQPSHLSTMVGMLQEAQLLVDGKKLPKLSISIPTNFFEMVLDEE